jgi:hypothetical protein
MEQMLRLLHSCGLPVEDVDFINCDGKTMNKLLLEVGFLYLFFSYKRLYCSAYIVPERLPIYFLILYHKDLNFQFTHIIGSYCLLNSFISISVCGNMFL